MCEDGFCRLALPRSFYELTVPVSVYEYTFDDAFRALKMQALADGWVLTKKGSKVPFEVSAKQNEDKSAAFVSCVDSTVKIVEAVHLAKYLRADSLKCSKKAPVDTTKPPLQSSRYRINFYVVSSSFLRDIGVDWVEMFAQGKLWSKPEFFSDWSLRAVAQGDTTCEFRTLELDIDSVASLHWGSKTQEQTSTYVTANAVQSNYEYYDYGLTLELKRRASGIRGEYKLAQRDDMKSVIEGDFGGSSDSLVAFGVFDSYKNNKVGVPFLSKIPWIGHLFEEEKVDKTKSFFVIQIVSLEKLDSPKQQSQVLDSLKTDMWDYFFEVDNVE